MKEKTKLNFGCGKDIRKDYVNMDIVKLNGVDVVHDFNKLPYPFKDNAFEEINCRLVLCMVDDLVSVMNELHRICRTGAIIKIYDTYYNCSGTHNEPYLKRSFNDNSFNFLQKNYETGFYTKEDFKIMKRELVPTRFGKLFPKFVRRTIGMILGEVFSNVYFEIKVIKK